MFSNLIGYRYFKSVNKETKEEIEKCSCCFVDTDHKADNGELYISLSFRIDKLPCQLEPEHIGRKCLVDTGFVNGVQYGKGLAFLE